MLRDTFNRPVTNLRVSLTQACDLNCIYCHAEGEVNPSVQLSAEEIGEIIRVATDFGVRSVKFTGGEPLLREDLTSIIQAVPSGIETSITTNATHLADKAYDLHDAGLSRANISLDTMIPERYKQITGKDCLSDVFAGIEAAVDAGLTPVKLNMVVLENINEDEIDSFIDFVRGDKNLILQLIELMEFRNCPYHGDVKGLEELIAGKADEVVTRRMHHRKKYLIDGAEVEVVRPLHNTEFCSFCNRLRLTSDGKLKPCLLRNDNLIDIRGLHGEELKACFSKAVMQREPYFK
ncbi:GTP 3',8-cyclase MoaA [Methanosphaerula palustris]|jgi:cyclic pyranopterin phosphate synthase|uniref:Probable GTP 3',8-cyclase n=1 Tax=Methanosphaerula palustris (strain ATCC BAA-1556 / DSM 19958 / E1-9c) TaxID=521011 RepID=B8GG78_METPE|nr:GTP 3',8-cyclase MoaA [Methanosphaerula palustris]ACL16152.1 molybdenum cofactor biosynthesis protein A [Methanosphaerula palustris E1-9c]